MEEKIEEILRNRVLDITDEYKGTKREEGIQVYLGYPKQLIDELTALLSQSKKDVIEELEKKWEERIIEAKQALYNEYGVNHKYTPHYEAILDDILLSLKDK